MKDRKVAWIGALLAIVHAFISIGHMLAHRELGIQMAPWQDVFILIVIGVGPIVGAVLLWTTHLRLGALLFATSMGGALVFGVYYHYIAISPDNVAHLPSGNLQGLFRSTAVLLIISQVLGIGVGIWGVYKNVGKTNFG